MLKRRKTDVEIEDDNGEVDVEESLNCFGRKHYG